MLLGRKREGRIVMLMTEGKEQETYKRSQSTRKSIFNVGSFITYGMLLWSNHMKKEDIISARDVILIATSSDYKHLSL